MVPQRDTMTSSSSISHIKTKTQKKNTAALLSNFYHMILKTKKKYFSLVVTCLLQSRKRRERRDETLELNIVVVLVLFQMDFFHERWWCNTDLLQVSPIIYGGEHFIYIFLLFSIIIVHLLRAITRGNPSRSIKHIHIEIKI